MAGKPDALERWGEFIPWGDPKSNAIDSKLLDQCIHCGFCLQACPTYRETGLETASPRGRLAMMKGVVQGDLESDAGFAYEMNLCLGCRACESACPSGVQYGLVLEQARDLAEKTNPQPRLQRYAIRRVLPNARRLRSLVGLLGFYQRSGLRHLARRLHLVPAALRDMERALPEAPRRREPLATGSGPVRVGLFLGCIQDALFQGTNAATSRLLAAAGCTVVVPDQLAGQTCCGALAAHAGDRAWAKELARQNIAAFEQVDVQYIVNNAGGCGALLKEYSHLLHDEPEWAERAAAFAAKVKDISEVLVAQGLHKQELALPGVRVTYQDSCHLVHGQKVKSPPRTLLKAIKGIQYVELRDADRCCGSAGIYNLTHPEVSGAVLAEKMENAKATRAEIIVTANPGCLLQMRLGVERAGLADKVRVVHLVDLLDEALQAQGVAVHK